MVHGQRQWRFVRHMSGDIYRMALVFGYDAKHQGKVVTEMLQCRGGKRIFVSTNNKEGEVRCAMNVRDHVMGQARAQ